MKTKLDSVSRAHSDIQNLMAATNVGILFLDAQLKINRFTQRSSRASSASAPATSAGRSPTSPTASTTTASPMTRAR